MTRSRKGKTVSLTGDLLEGFMLMQRGPSRTQPWGDEEKAQVLLTMIHLAIVEGDQKRALAVVKGMLEAVRVAQALALAKAEETKEEAVAP
jgi:hypothetical protein